MSHYDPSEHQVKLRCDGDHSWGDPYLGSSDIGVVFEDGEIYVKVQWRVQHTCTNDYTNNASSVKNSCQRVKTVERDSCMVPISDITSMIGE